MNAIIRDQLARCKVASVPSYSEDDTVIVIPKQSESVITPYQLHKFYLVEIADWILHPAQDFTLAANWNKGQIPTCKYYNAEIAQIVGKMIRITGCGYDPTSMSATSDVWDGWIPQKGLKLIKEIT